MALTARSIRQFSADLASTKPAPGGGAAAALTCSLGAALYVMALKITARSEGRGLRAQTLLRLAEKIEKQRTALLALVDQDAQAYLKLMQCWRRRNQMPAKAFRKVQLRALEVPLEICHRTAEVLGYEPTVRSYAGRMLISDVKAASSLLAGGFSAATATVRVNIDGLKDPAEAATYLEKLKNLSRTLSANTIKD